MIRCRQRGRPDRLKVPMIRAQSLTGLPQTPQGTAPLHVVTAHTTSHTMNSDLNSDLNSEIAASHPSPVAPFPRRGH